MSLLGRPRFWCRRFAGVDDAALKYLMELELTIIDQEGNWLPLARDGTM